MHQALALEHWRPILVGESLTARGLSVAEVPITLMAGESILGWREFRHRVFRFIGSVDRDVLLRLSGLGAKLIHAHFGTGAVDVWPYARVLGLPLLVTLHGHDINTNRSWWEGGRGGWRRKSYPEALLRMAQEPSVHFIAVSELIRRNAVEFGIPKQKIVLHHIGIDTNVFRVGGVPLCERSMRILFVGRMVEKKAPLLMVRAFAKIYRRVVDSELIMVGDGPLLQRAKKLSQELAVPITFTGALAEKDVLEQLNMAKVLCLPSVTAQNGDAEGFGLVLLEAQACGVPVVSSACGGATEGLVDGVTGFRCNEWDVDCLSDRIIRCLSDHDLSMRMSQAAAVFVREKFNLVERTRELESLYDLHSQSAGAFRHPLIADP